ncbi:MAG: hypothetical protein A2Z47_14065 [Thermodesulfovibrio sp. RBG_19FT_COMBO_42_12]|nr:MAG: hypothetical protein A2Z47_14065 [Thermodesulfovibrio sp. RBG_19FT_COMBO_42_12]
MKLSREGKRFLIATALIAVAALNTGNNLIYLILSMMLSILVLSILILRGNMNGLELRVYQLQPVFANGPANMNITILNKKRLITSYSIKVLMPEGIKGETFFPKISGLSDKLKTVPVVYEKRGIFKYGDFFIESSFPFILFSAGILCRVKGEVIVYPEIKETDEIVPEITSGRYEPFLPRTGRGDEFSMIREFRYGDDWRRIHWKTSAKTAKFMVMEYAGEEPRKLTIIFDNLRPHDTESFEKAVSFSASISDRFLSEGFFVRLLTCRKVIPFGSGKEHLFKILDVLAVIEGQDSWECPISDETEGPTILILNSDGSSLNKFIPVSDMVIYASTL